MLRDLRPYEAFVAIVEHETITSAAATLGRSLQAVSRDLARLESDLGVPLLVRTTRSRQLTPVGRDLYRRVKIALNDLESARDDAMTSAARIAGRMLVAAPTLLGVRLLTPMIAEFQARFAEVRVVLELTDTYVDPATSGADVTVRLGETPPSSLKVRSLGVVRRVAVASPGYIASRGRPMSPADLAAHECVIRRGDREAARWSFQAGDRLESVAVGGRFETDSVAASIEAMVQGLGIGMVAFWQVRDLITEGRLALLLQDFEAPPRPLQALWAPSAQLPTRARLFVDHLVKRFSAQQL